MSPRAACTTTRPPRAAGWPAFSPSTAGRRCPWSASTLSLGSLRAQDLAQRIPPRFARTLWSRLHYWEFIKRDRTWTWSTMVSKFSLILKDVNRWIEKGREDADETAVVYGGERS